MVNIEDILIDEDKKEYYNKLLKQKENGKKFTKQDLTYDVLYKLSIEENITDEGIGNLFNLKKEQVRYIRNKNGLGNVYLKKDIESAEQVYQKLKENGYENLSEQEFYDNFYKSIRIHAKLKKWKSETCEQYIKEFENKRKNSINIKNDDNIDLINLELEYDVVVDNLSHKGSRNSTTNKNSKKTSNGRKVNNRKNNETKIKIGKLGEKIVFDYERKKLIELGLTDLADKVTWITKTDDEDITFDGLGYDIVSYNEKGEKIYIEVKTSSTNNNVSFYISKKEIDFIKGKIDDIDVNKKFIYYVSDINQKLTIAKILIIDNKTFSKFNLDPKVYKVDEIFDNKEN